MSEDIKSYRQLESEYAELEIELVKSRNEGLKLHFEVQHFIEVRAKLMEEVRELRESMFIMREIKELAQTYEEAYKAFGFLVGDAMENSAEFGLDADYIIDVVTSSLKLYNMILIDLPAVRDIDSKNRNSMLGTSLNLDEIPF